MKKAYFAGGCFWCMQPAFKNLEGVSSVLAGYHGEQSDSPVTYDNSKGYTEAVEVTYNMDEVSYEEILDVFWKSIDPTDEGGQFYDRGEHYQTAIYFQNEEENKIAEKSKVDLGNSDKFDKPIVTKILPFDHFYLAEENHQNYAEKNPEHYERYAKGSGRKDFLKNIWDK